MRLSLEPNDKQAKEPNPLWREGVYLLILLLETVWLCLMLFNKDVFLDSQLCQISQWLCLGIVILCGVIRFSRKRYQDFIYGRTVGSVLTICMLLCAIIRLIRMLR